MSPVCDFLGHGVNGMKRLNVETPRFTVTDADHLLVREM
jgi:hypothetical protein